MLFSRSKLAVPESKDNQKLPRPISWTSSPTTSTTRTSTSTNTNKYLPFSIQLPRLPALSQKEASRINDMTLGSTISLGVLYVLGLEGDSSNQFELVDTVTSAASNIFASTVPGTTYDIVSIALGEAVAGLTGAMASLGLNVLLTSTRKFMTSTSTSNASQAQPMLFERTQGMVNQAVAESDYFLARAAVFPILEAVGLPSSLATISSSLLATFPYELVKRGKQQKMARQQTENRLLEQLLQQQQAQQAQSRRVEQQAKWNSLPQPVLVLLQPWRLLAKNNNSNLKQQQEDKFEQDSATIERVVVDPSKLQPILIREANVTVPAIDGVEVFADACKWMSYSVLMKDFSGTLTLFEGGVGGATLSTGVESGLFGLVATLTSQLYADFLYVTARAGPAEQQELAKSRTPKDWISLYVRKSISAFTLFGVYASVQLPVRFAVNSLLSGGLDSCIGSSDLDLCMETYYTQNPPSADMAAQLRALATTLYSLSNLPVQAWTMGLGPSPEAELRAVFTTLVSLWTHMF